MIVQESPTHFAHPLYVTADDFTVADYVMDTKPRHLVAEIQEYANDLPTERPA